MAVRAPAETRRPPSCRVSIQRGTPVFAYTVDAVSSRAAGGSFPIRFAAT